MSATRRLLALLVGTVTVLLLVALAAAPASAHPLGNFTINRYADIEVSAGTVRVRYVLDLAEIPAFQVRDEVAADPEGFAEEQVEEIAEGLRLEVDGQRLPLTATDRRLSQLDGQGGLDTLRLEVLYEAALPGGGADEVLEARFADTNGTDRIGWREIVVQAAGDARILESTAPDEGVSDALRSYPEDRLGSPLDVEEAAFSFTPGNDEVAARPLGAGGDADVRSGDRFTDLLDRQDLTPVVLVGMLAVAALVGVGHALAPGHGKTVMAAYLIGTRGRPIDAVLLGVIVSAMHTTSVLLLGVALYQVDQSFALDRIYPALTLASGVGVLLIGVWLATTRARALRARSHAVAAAVGLDHEHDHGDHEHDHGDHAGDHHPHGKEVQGTGVAGGGAEPAPVAMLERSTAVHDHDGHDHSHDGHGHHHGPGGHSHELPEGVAPLSKRGLVLLATAGGVVPSPSAVIVLVSAFTLGRVGLGLALVAAFSIGLAATLTAVGLALVLGSRALGDRVSGRVVRVFPILGAVALLVLGTVLIVQGATGL